MAQGTAACSPARRAGGLGPIADSPGLIDEYVLVIHPAVLASGPRLFDHLTRDLALTLTSARFFESGAAVVRYRTLETTAAATRPPSASDIPEQTP